MLSVFRNLQCIYVVHCEIPWCDILRILQKVSPDGGGVDAEDDQELRKARERLEKKREARMGKPLTKLERALKKVTSSGGMLKKKKKTGASKGGSKDSSSFGRNKKKAEGSAAGKALLHRAMGSGIVGGFKGKGKKKGKR